MSTYVAFISGALVGVVIGARLLGWLIGRWLDRELTTGFGGQRARHR